MRSTEFLRALGAITYKSRTAGRKKYKKGILENSIIKTS